MKKTILSILFLFALTGCYLFSDPIVGMWKTDIRLSIPDSNFFISSMTYTFRADKTIQATSVLEAKTTPKTGTDDDKEKPEETIESAITSALLPMTISETGTYTDTNDHLNITWSNNSTPFGDSIPNSKVSAIYTISGDKMTWTDATDGTSITLVKQ